MIINLRTKRVFGPDLYKEVDTDEKGKTERE